MTYLPSYIKRLDAQGSTSSSPTGLAVWLFFHLVANHMLLTLLIATFLFSRSVSRHPTIINVCCTCVIAGITSSLLFYTGHQLGPEPPKGLCIAQASLTASIPPMLSTATFSLVFHTWWCCRFARLKDGRRVQSSRKLTVCLVAVPYIIYLSFAAGLLPPALQHPDRVSRSRRVLYCSIQSSAYNDAVALFTAGMCLLSVAFAVHLAYLMSRSRTVLRGARREADVDLRLAVRVGIFTAYILCVTGYVSEYLRHLLYIHLGAHSRYSVMLSELSTAHSVIPDMFVASVGLGAFIIFASQRDVLHVWSNILTCGRHNPNPSEPHTPSPSTGLGPACTNSTAESSSSTLCQTPLPAFDCDLLERKDSVLSEKARLAALHAYYKARVQDMGVGVEIIKRPEDAFFFEKAPLRAWDVAPWS
ncbi:hypothetical protein C8Q80DRAFT_404208 [Daedaleopsis nitida]|nr:hypothetical protein C8Q80DRAFT_404208 [Daedaleopsis nitida]